MSVQLLHKSLDLVNKEDGIEPKTKRRTHKSSVAKDRDILKNLDERFVFDVNEGRVVKRQRNEVHKGTSDLGQFFRNKDAKMGYSLIEQYRHSASNNPLKRDPTDSRKLRVPKSVIKELNWRSNESQSRKQQQRKNRLNLQDVFYNKKKPKRENTSVFTDDDFKAANEPSNTVLQQKMRKIK